LVEDRFVPTPGPSPNSSLDERQENEKRITAHEEEKKLYPRSIGK
jgi:hypothetical protein